MRRRSPAISLSGLLVFRPVTIVVLTVAACFAGVITGHAQAKPSSKSAAELSDDELVAAVANSLGPVGIVPLDRGFNASLITSSQHDSISGWSSLLTPSVAYRFNRYVSADVSTPIFFYLHSESTVVSPPGPNGGPIIVTTQSNVQHGIVGDTYMAAHVHTSYMQVRRRPFFDTVSGLLIAPTGSVTDGVGAGKTTFNVTNHLEMGGRWSPYVDIGLGSSSRVQNRRLQQDQTSRGFLANFAAGVRIDLPHQWDFAAEAFEQLPLGTQHVSQTEARAGGPPQTQQAVVASGLAENNGFNTALDIPLAPHFTMSGYYSRSLRQHEDIAGFSITFLLRTPRTTR